MKLRFACNHEATYQDAPTSAECPICQERRVSRVWAPAPTFRGLCTGPTATFDKSIAAHNTPLVVTEDGQEVKRKG